MRILHVGEYVKGGVYTYIYNVLEHQKADPAVTEVYLCASKNKSEDDYPISKENIHFYKYKRHPYYILLSFFSIFAYIHQVKPDVIHVHSTFAGILVRFPFLFWKKRVQIVYCSHGWSFLMETSELNKKIYILIEKLLSYKTDKLINISKYEYDQSIGVGLPSEKSILIYNGIEEYSEPQTKKTELQFDEKNINILFVGRFDKQKGIDILLEATKSITRKNITFYLIGDFVLSKNKDMDFPENTVQVGWVGKEEINYYYQAADVVVMPSRWEGFGLVAIEAMKNKKPVISSTRGALPELITDRVNGYLFDLKKPMMLKEILETCNKDELKKMGMASYEIFTQKFTSRKMNTSILRLYSGLVYRPKHSVGKYLAGLSARGIN